MCSNAAKHRYGPASRLWFVILSVCLCAAGGVAQDGSSAAEFLRERQVSEELIARVVEARSSARGAERISGGETVLGLAKQSFRSRRGQVGAEQAAKLRAQKEVLAFVWKECFPRFSHPDLLLEAMARSESGLALQGSLKGARSERCIESGAVYFVVRMPLDGVELRGKLPEETVVQAAYLETLRLKIPSLERAGKTRTALEFAAEHERFEPLPRSLLPVVGLCHLAGEERSRAVALADVLWSAPDSSGSSGFWFDLSELEQRLGREEPAARALKRAYAAWNRENAEGGEEQGGDSDVRRK